MSGINDSPELASQLVALLKGVLCHVNLIPLNPVAGSPFQPSPPERVAAFQAVLVRGGIPATLRARPRPRHRRGLWTIAASRCHGVEVIALPIAV